MISWPFLRIAAIASTACTTYVMSGSLVLRSGVGTQMSRMSTAASAFGSVVAVNLPFFTTSARCADDTSGM